jgi:hypothetical protein
MPLTVTVITIAECLRTDCNILGGGRKSNRSLLNIWLHIKVAGIFFNLKEKSYFLWAFILLSNASDLLNFRKRTNI